jgi:acetoin utilization deacetylase AcuC-like enzyme
LVSCGFDAHWKDPLTSLGLSTTGIYNLARTLVGLADDQCRGRIVFVLEGGYDPGIVASSGTAVLAALAGSPYTPASEDALFREPEVGSRLAAIKALHHL